jgi:hypothetical protein
MEAGKKMIEIIGVTNEDEVALDNFIIKTFDDNVK